jgi:hypothetical protein
MTDYPIQITTPNGTTITLTSDELRSIGLVQRAAIWRVIDGLERDAGNAVLGDSMMGKREGRLDAAQRLRDALGGDRNE